MERCTFQVVLIIQKKFMWVEQFQSGFNVISFDTIGELLNSCFVDRNHFFFVFFYSYLIAQNHLGIFKVLDFIHELFLEFLCQFVQIHVDFRSFYLVLALLHLEPVLEVNKLLLL